ncbi:MAG: M1 family aminopeptidase [Bacteroidota bacterium]|nr:M1 family aminopeptidase [Bacteroidota bacterium]
MDKKTLEIFTYLWNYMKKLYSILCFLLLFNLKPAYIQANRTDSIDIIHYNINNSIRNFSSKYIEGTVYIKAVFKYNQVKNITLDLLKLNPEFITGNGDTLNFSKTDSTVHISITKNYQLADTINLSISYSGFPVLDPKWGGFFFNGNYAYNMGVGMASNPPGFGRCWFPCIDNFTDRATYEFHITTDSGYMAVCNGLQEPATPNNGGICWNWYLHQAIPTYIANVAVSKYVLLNNVYHGIQRDIPIILAVEPKDTANMKASFIRLNDALTCFESKFGPYLFDRIGYVGVPFNSGAMEHAGNISYPLYAVDGTTASESLIAHELSHHWWGNLVTARTPSDMWLNEGWASYCEALYLECVYGNDAYNADINNKLFTALRWAHVRDGAYMPVSVVPLAQTYGTHVYTKGALMVHSLRMLINDDTAFFNTCKSYLQKYSFKDASSTDLQNHFAKRFGGMINSFFNSYIFDKGHIDLQFVRADPRGDFGSKPVFRLMSRYKTNIPDSIFAFVKYYDGEFNKVNQYFQLLVRNKYSEDFIGYWDAFNLALLGEKPGTMLGVTTQSAWVKGTGVQSFPSALFTFTPQQNTDSSFVFVQHHFVRPWQEKGLFTNGIRVSSERYWHINGIWPKGFKSTAFFNYDGTTANKNSGHLDNELITGTEDSLVLLYRPNAQTAFAIETDLTKQTGSSLTDKTGRFWVNNLKKGDYVFGYYDVKAGIGSVENEKRLFKVFPNPSEGMVKVEFPFEHNAGIIEVYDITGKLVYSENIEAGKNELVMKTPLWKPGSYILKFNDGLGQVNSKFIVN